MQLTVNEKAPVLMRGPFLSAGGAYLSMPSVHLPQPASVGQGRKSKNQEEYTSEHGIQSLAAGAFPFTCCQPPDVGGDDNGRHEERPTKDGSHIAEARSDVTVDNRATKPHRTHDGSEHPVAAGPRSLIKTSGLVLLPEIDAIEDVGNERGGVERRPDHVGLAAGRHSLQASDFFQFVAKGQSKVDQR